MSYFGKIVKNTVIMFTVGALLAVVSPALISLTGLTGIVTAPNILWEAAFFGGFGGIHAAIEPIIDRLVSRPAHRHSVHRATITSTPGTTPYLPVIAQSASIEGVETDKFQQQLSKKPFETESFQERVSASRVQAQEQSI